MKKNNRLILPAAAVFFWYAQYVHMPFQTPYLTSIAVGSGMAGVIVGSYGMTQMLLRTPVGILCDLKGRYKPFILLSCLGAAMASALRYFWPSSTGFLIANLAGGVAAAGWVCFMCGYTSCFPKEELARASGTIIAGDNLGILLGYFSGMLFHDRIGLRSLCLTGIASAAAAFLLASLMQESVSDDSADKESISVSAALKTIFTDRRIWVFGLVSLVQQGFIASTSNAFTSQVLKNRGASGTLLGLSSIIYMAAAVVTTRLNGGRLHRKLGPAKTAFLVLLLCTLYCFLVPNLQSIGGIIVCQILAGISQGWLYSSNTAEAIRDVPDAIRTTATGAYCSIYSIGMMVFPMFLGWVNEVRGMAAAFYCVGLITALTGIAMLFYREAAQRSNS